MSDSNDGWSKGTSQVERMKQFLVDAFGPDVLRELPLRLDVLRERTLPRPRDWNRYTPARPAPRS